MVWYVPPLSPVADVTASAGYDETTPDAVFAAIDALDPNVVPPLLFEHLLSKIEGKAVPGIDHLVAFGAEDLSADDGVMACDLHGLSGHSWPSIPSRAVGPDPELLPGAAPGHREPRPLACRTKPARKRHPSEWPRPWKVYE